MYFSYICSFPFTTHSFLSPQCLTKTKKRYLCWKTKLGLWICDISKVSWSNRAVASRETDRGHYRLVYLRPSPRARPGLQWQRQGGLIQSRSGLYLPILWGHHRQLEFIVGHMGTFSSLEVHQWFFSKHHMLSIQPNTLRAGDEELTAICTGPVCHWKQSWSWVPKFKIFSINFSSANGSQSILATPVSSPLTNSPPWIRSFIILWKVLPLYPIRTPSFLNSSVHIYKELDLCGQLPGCQWEYHRALAGLSQWLEHQPKTEGSWVRFLV